MGLMNFLSKVGGIFRKTETVMNEVKPLVSIAAAFLPAAVKGNTVSIFDGVFAVVQGVEAITSAAGDKSLSSAQKLAAAVPQVAAIISASQFMLDKQVIDVDMFSSACEDFINGSVKLQKAITQVSADTVNTRIQEAAVLQAKLSGQWQSQPSITTLRQ